MDLIVDVPRGERNFDAKFFSVHGSAMGCTSCSISKFSSSLEFVDRMATVKVDKMSTGLPSLLTYLPNNK